VSADYVTIKDLKKLIENMPDDTPVDFYRVNLTQVQKPFARYGWDGTADKSGETVTVLDIGNADVGPDPS